MPRGPCWPHRWPSPARPRRPPSAPPPTTDALSTTPTTDAPTTSAPTTDAPTTGAPTTSAPTTAPTTTAPVPNPTIIIPSFPPLPTLLPPVPVTTTPAPGPTTTTPAPPIAPQYGLQKVKVGIKLKTGAVVPPGTSLAGAVLSVSYGGTTPVVTLGDPGLTLNDPNSCTTDASGFCSDQFSSSGYVVVPGGSLTVTEVSAPTGLVAASGPQTVGPCVTDAPDPADPSLPGCANITVLLDQTGPLPLAPSQTTQAPAGQPVSIGLPADAGNGAPVQSVTVTQGRHGSVSYLANAFTYRPNPGFSGRDSFDYTVHTANGDSTGTITVEVAAAATTAPATTAPASVTSTTAPVTATTTAPSTAAPAVPVTSSAAVAPVVTSNPATPASSGALALTGASGIRDMSLGGAAMMVFGAAAVSLGRRRRVPVETRRH